MTFPQPSANKSALSGGEFFRLNTALVTAGDMYESTQSGRAFALGPNSDISRVNINYFDPNAPNGVAQATLSLQRSMIGRIDARNNDTYQPSGRPARVLIWPDEIFDSAWEPQGFTPPGDTVTFIQPVLDVIQYFTLPPSIVPQRSDRAYMFQRLPFPAGNTNLVLPFYGRRYASVILTNQHGVNLTGTLMGVNYCIDAALSLENQVSLGNLGTTSGNTTALEVLASAVGTFDALVLQMSFGGAVSGPPIMIRATLSDTEA